jgi:hypothetical protein
MYRSLPIFAMAVVVGLTACESQPLEVEPLEIGLSPSFSAAATSGATFAEVRSATARYHQVDVALADGYVADTPCIYNAPGGRGHIYTNIPLVDGVVDASRPELLLYEPTKNGRLRLVGVAFLVPAAAWDPFNDGPPTLGGQAFTDRRSPPWGAPFPNYVLFAWVWRHNPDGLHALYNPLVSCEYAEDAVVR